MTRAIEFVAFVLCIAVLGATLPASSEHPGATLPASSEHLSGSAHRQPTDHSESSTAPPLPSELPAPVQPLAHANGNSFAKIRPSDEVRRVVRWVRRTGNNQGLPFLIIDKPAATVLVFDAHGRVQAVAPVLLGIAKGDRFAPGAAEKDMYQTRAAERITPAGRFLAERGIDDKGRDLVWIDYDAGIALHPVLDNPGERRPERLQTATPDDNRISYGCVNVPADFYATVVRPLFAQTKAFVYVLPESEHGLLFASR